MKRPIIETDRLMLRPHAVDDAEAVYRLATDQALVQFIRGLPATREDAWHRLLRYAGHWSLLGFGMFAVLERQTGPFIGEVGLADFRRGLGSDFDHTPEAAWLFAGDAHGRGYAGEAMGAMLEWFDREHRRSRTVCIIDPANPSSIKLASRLGFTRYGDGHYRDAAIEKYERVQAFVSTTGLDTWLRSTIAHSQLNTAERHPEITVFGGTVALQTGNACWHRLTQTVRT